MTPADANPIIFPVNPTDPSREYVAFPSYRYSGVPIALREILTTSGETSDLTDKVIEAMLLDSAVSSALGLLRDSVFGEELIVTPSFRNRVLSHDEPKFVAAKRISDFVERVLKRDEIVEQIEELSEAFAFGAAFAELVWDLAPSGKDAGKVILERLKVKPREAIRFVTDRFLNLQGFVDSRWGVTQYVPEGYIMPRYKGLVLTVRGRKADPRGTPLLKAARTAWEQKVNAYPDLARILRNQSQPPLVGTLPANEAARQARIPGQEKPGTATEAFGLTMAGLWETGKHTIVIPAGATVDALPIPAQSGAYESALKFYDRQITQAILLQTRATMEAEHGSKADSGTGYDVLGKLILSQKHAVCRALRRDVVQILLRVNFGDAALDFVPRISLGDTDGATWEKDATAAAALGYKLHPTQFAVIDEMLGLPVRDPDQIAAYDADQMQKQQAMAGAMKTANESDPNIEP